MLHSPCDLLTQHHLPYHPHSPGSNKSSAGSLSLLAASAQNRCTALVCSCYAPSTKLDSNKNNSRKQQEKRDHGVMEPTNGPPLPLLPPTRLRSNLKNTTIPVEAAVTRKVTWPDAHGKAIAHIHEFEPSESADAELEGVRNSCVCTIQ